MKEVNGKKRKSAGKAKKTSYQWAWWDAEMGQFCHVYPSRHCVEMCFPDEGKHKMELGLGEIMRVTVTEGWSNER